MKLHSDMRESVKGLDDLHSGVEQLPKVVDDQPCRAPAHDVGRVCIKVKPGWGLVNQYGWWGIVPKLGVNHGTEIAHHDSKARILQRPYH